MTAIIVCECDAGLAAHCASDQCTWLRCHNKTCPWSLWDVARGVRLDRAGRVSPMVP